MTLPTLPTLTSHDGLTLPVLGLGTYTLNGVAGEGVVSDAIDAGYTLVDSAFNYENEGAVGHAIRRSAVPRERLLMSSKLPGRHHAYESAVRTIEESVYRTGLDHLDVYLIHWPNPKVGLYVEAWRALIEARDRGLVHAIGVSNFLPEHLERLEAETGVRPAVNQIELHPYFPQTEALAYHRERGILVEAWSPLARGRKVFEEPTLAAIADAHHAGVGQIILAWHRARGVIALPRSTSPERLRENLASTAITLSEAEVAQITALGRPDGRIAEQDPAVYEEC